MSVTQLNRSDITKNRVIQVSFPLMFFREFGINFFVFARKFFENFAKIIFRKNYR